MKKKNEFTDEVWKDVPYTEGKYQVSNYGQIRSFARNPEGTIIQLSEIQGFYVANLPYKGKRKSQYVHKIVAEVFLPKTNKNQTVVNHKDWEKKNNQVDNLEWVSREDSYKRLGKRISYLRGLKKSKTPGLKLNPNDVKQIKKMIDKGVKEDVIAKLFCITEAQVSRIKKQK